MINQVALTISNEAVQPKHSPLSSNLSTLRRLNGESWHLCGSYANAKLHDTSSYSFNVVRTVGCIPRFQATIAEKRVFIRSPTVATTGNPACARSNPVVIPLTAKVSSPISCDASLPNRYMSIFQRAIACTSLNALSWTHDLIRVIFVARKFRRCLAPASAAV